LFEKGDQLLRKLQDSSRPVVGLLASGGQRVLRLIELWNYETVLHRPKLAKASKMAIMMAAWLKSRLHKRGPGKA
jgi:phytoene/squalene synthetase